MTKLTPMMEQYMNIKNEHKDALLFFRLGDFYEMFHEDAVVGARELEITLTKRDSSDKNSIPMCGVPHHSAAGYIRTLVEKGYKVAICEQVEDPKHAKGIVKREVVQLVTPGTVMEFDMVRDQDNNYLTSLTMIDELTFIVIYTDLTTGEVSITALTNGWEEVLHELFHQPVKEIVISGDLPNEYQEQLFEQLQVVLSVEDNLILEPIYKAIVDDLEDFYQVAMIRMLNYIERTQKRSLEHLQQPVIIERTNHLLLDKFSKRNLELSETILRKEKYGSLFWVLDRTVTAMGARLLKKWIERPLLNEQVIDKRLDIVAGFYDDLLLRAQFNDILKTVYDLERIIGRVSYGNANARDLLQLRKSLEQIPHVQEILEQFNEPAIIRYSKELDRLDELVTLLQTSIVDEPPISIKEGAIIKTGFHEKLDTYRSASTNGKQWIAELEAKEKIETGIRSLKIGFNRVFGYYIEVTKTNLDLIPENRYERKQTLTNAERFITTELKEKETLILEAEEKMIDIEYDLFNKIRDEVKLYTERIQMIAKNLSELDVLQAFATISEEQRYVRPTFSKDEMHIKQSRHSVIEAVMKQDTFVPNDFSVSSKHNMLLITGPNMSGKSTYMRQLALTVIMAQIGCFVPADTAELMIVDQVFTRIGAADDLVQGQSTFMVEMLETNHALQNATDRSLILLDEIGRGTSTYDGMALAQAIIEYIHDEVGAITLFSTHYHELTSLEDDLSRLDNIHVQAEEHDGEVVFLHKVAPGPADESYGIHVAKLAQVPSKILQRATDILSILESESPKTLDHKTVTAEQQMSLFIQDEKPKRIHEQEKPFINESELSISNALKEINVLELTPLEAMNELYRIQRLLKDM